MVTEAKESNVHFHYSSGQDFSRRGDVSPYDRILSALENL